jgi:dienelactone hydrolase
MRTQRDLVYYHGTARLRGLLCGEAPGKMKPGMLVFHDAMGLGNHAVDRAERLSELGYVSLAADLYGERTQPRDSTHALELLRGLRDDPGNWRGRAMAAFEALKGVPGVDSGRIGAIGFCVGGSTALELARAGAELAATVCFHGGLDTQLKAQPGAIKGSVLVCTGSEDSRVPVAQVHAFLDEMSAVEVDCQVIVYAGVRHSFTNVATDGLPGMAYDMRADRRSWAAMRVFLGEKLGVER